MFIHNNINTRVFTPYSTIIITTEVIRFLLSIQSNHFLYNLSISFRTHTTLSLPPLSCHPSIISFITLTISFLSSAKLFQCSKNALHIPLLLRHTSYRSVHPSLIHTTYQFQFSTLLVPPLSIILCLLQSISTHLALHLQSINLLITSKF